MRSNWRSVGRVGIVLGLAACTPFAESLGTVQVMPSATSSSPPTSSVTPSAASALAPPGGPDLTPLPLPTVSGDSARLTLASIVESQSSFLTGGAMMNLLPAMPPVLVDVEYSSELRPVAPETKGFLWQFGDSFGQIGFADGFQQELLVREGDQEFWMPVQEPLPSSLEDLAAGQTLTVGVRLLGSLQTDQGLRVIFIVVDVQD